MNAKQKRSLKKSTTQRVQELSLETRQQILELTQWCEPEHVKEQINEIYEELFIGSYYALQEANQKGLSFKELEQCMDFAIPFEDNEEEIFLTGDWIFERIQENYNFYPRSKDFVK